MPKSNYNKLVCITLIDFFYHFLTNTTKQDIYLHFISISIKYHDTVSHRDIFGSDTKGVDNVGARGALATPDFQCVNMYKHLKKNSYKTTQHMVTSLLIILSKYMNSTPITLKWAWPQMFFVARFACHIL